MEHVLTALAILFWMALGALIAVTAIAVARANSPAMFSEDEINEAVELARRVEAQRFAPFSELLGKPCWVKSGHGNQARWRKHRVVAVSHKGAICVRPWSDGSGRGAFWVPKGKVDAKVRWEEACDEQKKPA